MIEKAIIESIKTNTDLRTYIESRGIEFKKNGKGYFALCPFHDDTNPSLSINPKNNLFKCFGCGKSGDIIRFVELYDQVDFKGALNILSQNNVRSTPSLAGQAKRPKPSKTALSVKEKKLLGRVMTYYQHTLTQDKRGLNYLTNDRGINNLQSIKDFGTGYANGTLLEILPQDEEVIQSLKKIGILNKKGNEVFYNSVVFPLVNASKSPVSLYGRNIDESIDMNHLYLPGPRTGLSFNAYSVVKQSQTAILTESIIDGLTLYDQGFKNVIPIYGTNGLIDDHLNLMQGKIKQAYIVFDADEAGKKGAEALASRLKEKDITPHIVDLPSKDVNLFFSRHTPEEFEALLKQTNPDSLEESQSVSSRKQTLYKQTEYGFTVAYADRQYQIKGIQRTSTQLKATVKVSKDVESNLPFELSTIDFYSSRSRVWFAKLCSNLFESSEELIREDLGRLMTLIEEYQPPRLRRGRQDKEPTLEEKERAMEFLKNKNFIKELLEDIKTLGVVGEETNILVCYLAAVSRSLNTPLSVLILSRSGAGKSTVQKAIMKLVPAEAKKEYTRISDQALFYKEEDALVHKVIAIEEEAGIGGAAYALRNIQSSGEITLAVVAKDSTGQMHTEEYTVKGPVAVMLTTTSTDIDQETASRFITLSIDESEQMTKAILAKQRQEETLEGLINQVETECIINKHHTAQRLLKPVAVVNPYSEYLTYPARSLTARRDQKKYLGLIQTIAYLRQYQKEIKTLKIDPATDGKEYIEVDLYDIELANQLANEVLGHSLDELSRSSRTLLNHIYTMVAEMSKKEKIPFKEVSFSRRMIREYCKWTDWQIRAHIKQLEELEYIHARIGCQGKQYTYAINYRGQCEKEDVTNQGKCCLNLTPVEEIKKLIKKLIKKK